MAKIGVVTALINSNLVADPLAHSIKVSEAKAVIYGSDYAKGFLPKILTNLWLLFLAIKDIYGKISTVKLYQFSKNSDTDSDAVDLVKELENQEDTKISELNNGGPKDKLLFIFTSGTTGLPKAAVITNMRFMFMALGIRYMAAITENDIIYDPLPLYHSAGAIVGVGQCVLKGTTVVIRKKFSASYFWVDCIKYRCTV